MPKLPIHPGRASGSGARRSAAPWLRAAALGLAWSFAASGALALPPVASPAAAEGAPAAKKKAATPSAAPSSDVAAASGGSQMDRAKASFEIFSKEWMEKMERAARETAMAAKATVRRGYPPGFTTELKPTDSATAPFVGLLRYVEEEHSCQDTNLTDCKVTGATNVTEIFRYQGGKWIY